MSEEEPEVWNMKAVNSGHSASDVGLQARSMQVADDAPMDTSWRARDPYRIAESSNVAGDVIGRESQANQVAVNMRQRIEAIMAEDSPAPSRRTQSHPQQYRVKQTKGGLGLEDLMEGLDQSDINGLVNYDNPLYDPVGTLDDDFDDFGPTQKKSTPAWIVQEGVAQLQSGKKVRVWMIVSETNNGFEYKKPFRIEEAASRVANILNQTGNPNDPRIMKISESHDKYVKLLTKSRKLKKAIQEGRTDLKPQLNQIREQIEGVSLVLGI